MEDKKKKEVTALPVLLEEGDEDDNVVDDDDDDVMLMSVDAENNALKKKEVERKKSLIDLLTELWIPSFSACKNLRLIIGFIANYLANQSKKRKKTYHDVNRERESVAVKSVLIDFLGYAGESNNINTSSSKDDLRSLILAYRSHKLEVDGIDSFLRVSFLTETYNEWIVDYKKYIQTLYNERAAAAAATTVRSTQTEEEASGGGGGGGLFDTSIFFNKKDREEHLMKQYIARLRDDGVLNTWRTPGESRGHTLVRLDVYNVKDIANKDKRNWWKYAKVRSQFLYSPECSGKLQDLLNEAAKGLSKVEGLTMEERNFSN